MWAVCEQLIEYERAAAIQRRIVAMLGRGWSEEGSWCAGQRDCHAGCARRGGARGARLL